MRTRIRGHRTKRNSANAEYLAFNIAGMLFVLFIAALIAADVWFSHTSRML